MWTGMPLRTSCHLISPAGKDLDTCSNCARKQRHGETLKMYLIKKAAWQIKRPAWLFLNILPVWIIPYAGSCYDLLNWRFLMDDLTWKILGELCIRIAWKVEATPIPIMPSRECRWSAFIVWLSSSEVFSNDEFSIMTKHLKKQTST